VLAQYHSLQERATGERERAIKSNDIDENCIPLTAERRERERRRSFGISVDACEAGLKGCWVDR